MIDIEPVTVIMSLLLFGAFTVPFIYHSQKNKKKEKSLLSKLSEGASQQNAIPNEQETWRQLYAIGMDTSKKILVYHRENEQTSVLNLNEFSKVKLQKSNLEIANGEATRTVLHSLNLELIPKNAHASSIFLELYDGDRFSDLLGETVLAEKWEKIIQSNLN